MTEIADMVNAEIDSAWDEFSRTYPDANVDPLLESVWKVAFGRGFICGSERAFESSERQVKAMIDKAFGVSE